MFRWVDHTGEVELELECASEKEVFHDALVQGALLEKALRGVAEEAPFAGLAGRAAEVR